MEKITRGTYEGSGLVDSNEEAAAQITVATVNRLGAELGFTLEMESEPSKYKGYHQVTFTASKSVNPDFFGVGNGVFWSTLRSIEVGIRMIGRISLEEAEVIFRAEMVGVDTIQLISDATQRSALPDRQGQWQATIGEIQSQLSAAS